MSAKRKQLKKNEPKKPGELLSTDPVDIKALLSACLSYMMNVHNFRTALNRFGRAGGFEKMLDESQQELLKAMDKLEGKDPFRPGSKIKPT